MHFIELKLLAHRLYRPNFSMHTYKDFLSKDILQIVSLQPHAESDIFRPS